MEFQELADVLIIEIIQKLRMFDITRFNKLSHQFNLLSIHILWRTLSKSQPPLELLKKYGNYVTTIKDNGYYDLNFDYEIIGKYCKKLKLIKLSEYYTPSLNEMKKYRKDCKCIMSDNLKNTHVCFKDNHFLSLFKSNKIQIDSFYIDSNGESILLNWVPTKGFNKAVLDLSYQRDTKHVDKIEKFRSFELIFSYTFKSIPDCININNITKLMIERNPNVNDVLLSLFTRKFDSLKTLKFYAVSPELITNVYNNCPKLRFLSYFSNYTPPNKKVISRVNFSLKHIAFIDYKGEMDCKLYPKLTRIDISNEIFSLNVKYFGKIKILRIRCQELNRISGFNPYIETIFIDIIIYSVNFIKCGYFSKLVEAIPGLRHLIIFIKSCQFYGEFFKFNEEFNNIKRTLPKNIKLKEYLYENINLKKCFRYWDHEILDGLISYFHASLKFPDINFYVY